MPHRALSRRVGRVNMNMAITMIAGMCFTLFSTERDDMKIDGIGQEICAGDTIVWCQFNSASRVVLYKVIGFTEKRLKVDYINPNGSLSGVPTYCDPKSAVVVTNNLAAVAARKSAV